MVRRPEISAATLAAKRSCRTGTSRGEHYLPTNRQKVVAQFRRGNRGSRRAKQPLVPPRLSAISAPCTNAGRVQKRRGRVRADCETSLRLDQACQYSPYHEGRVSAPSPSFNQIIVVPRMTAPYGSRRTSRQGGCNAGVQMVDLLLKR